VIPVFQTIFGDGKGNCFAACVASILEIRLSTVPNFCADYPDGEHWEKFREWLKPFGLDALGLFGDPAEWGDHLPASHIIVCGPNSDGVLHAVVYYKGKLVHDPNPNGQGLAKADNFGVFVPREPHKHARQLITGRS